MSSPADSDVTMQSQMLLKISDNVAQLVTDVAVIKSQMAAGEYEKRIRDLEAAQASAQGGRDVAARWWAGAGALAAAGSAAAAWVAAAHHP